MKEIEAKDFIPGLSESFTFQELKKAFRRQSFLTHPDTGGTDYEFSLLQEAYQTLLKQAVHELGSEVHELQTIDGTPLSELGKGFPLTVSAKECEFCEGRGWKSFSNYTKTVTCPDCEGEGTFFLKCKKCDGTGDYKHPRTAKIIGKCNLCGGNGRFYPLYRRPNITFFTWWVPPPQTVVLPNGQYRKVNNCKRCKGDGNVEITDTSRLTYIKCVECKGTGEVKIYNPVLPRGFLVGGKNV